MTISGYTIRDGMSRVTSAIEDVAKAIQNVAAAQTKTPTSKPVTNVYNVYVTTSGKEATRDIAAAVQEAIDRVKSNDV